MDLYRILGVRMQATLVEIRRAYQRQARQFHPAVNPGDPAAEERFRHVAEAYAVLSDPQRRSEYDRGEFRASPVPSVPDMGFDGFDFSAEVRLGGVDYGPILEGFLRSTPTPAPGRGEDLEQRVRLTFDEALKGTRRRLHVVRQAACVACSGRGQVESGPAPCARCHGTGQARARRGRMLFSRRCPECGATGMITRRMCARCGGEGRVTQSEWVDVEVPAGVSHGARLPLRERGNAGRAGGALGDLVVTVEVEPHPFFRREGDDLHCVLPVTIAEAALGGHVDVPTPYGVVAIEIPAGTPSGQRFRLRKRGMPKVSAAARGDLYVEVRISTPHALDERSRELLREFARRNPQDPRQGLYPPADSRRRA